MARIAEWRSVRVDYACRPSVSNRRCDCLSCTSDAEADLPDWGHHLPVSSSFCKSLSPQSKVWTKPWLGSRRSPKLGAYGHSSILLVKNLRRIVQGVFFDCVSVYQANIDLVCLDDFYLVDAPEIFVGGAISQGIWGRKSPVGSRGDMKRRLGVWGRSTPETEAVCRPCLQMFTAESTKIKKCHTIHLLILDQYVSQWGLNDIWGA